MNVAAYRPMRDLALVEVLPRRDEITDWRVDEHGKLVDLSENPLPSDEVAVVRQWTGLHNPSTARYAGERTSSQLRRARVLKVGPEVTDLHENDVVVLGIFAGLEVEDKKDLRYIQENEALLVETP